MLNPARTLETNPGTNEGTLTAERGQNGATRDNTHSADVALPRPNPETHTTDLATVSPSDNGARSPLVDRETTALVKGELERVLGSKAFSRAPRLKRLLEYVVDQTLSGERKRLKEYTLGLEVFDRLPSFDPSSDPIVRVEASRLRSRLSVYYATEGAAGSIRIDLPKGGYTPTIRRVLEKPQRKDSEEPIPQTIIILPFALLGDLHKQAWIQVDALSYQLMHLLTRFSGARVLSRISSVQSKPGMDARTLGNTIAHSTLSKVA